MANNESATPITTGTQTGNRLKEKGIYYFKLGSEYFLYDEDEQRLCGLTGAEIDSNFHFLSGNDIKNVELNYSAGTVVITRVNNEYEPITLNLKEARPEYAYDPETGKLTVTYPDGEEKEVEGFFIDEGKYDLKVYTDSTLTGLGTEYSPLSLSRLERTGTFAPVETLVESGDVQDYRGKRVLTKELIDDYGHLYEYREAEAIQAALEAENSPWRVATKKDWDELLNAMEIDEEDRLHADYCDELRHGVGNTAGDVLKSNRLWEYPNGTTTNEHTEHYTGFDMLPVGYDTFPETATNDNQAELFGTNAGFWAFSDKEYCDTDLPLVKIFNTGGSVEQRGVQLDGLFSIRLVKEFTHECDEEYETILGSSYPIGVITGICVDYSKVWTLSNFYGVRNDEYSGKTIEGTNVPQLTNYSYFIVECDGSKKRLKEGESVVILDRGPHEWRVVKDANGEDQLIDTYAEVYDRIDEVSANFLTYINEFSAGTVDEFNSLREDLNTLSASTIENESAISNRVESVNTRVTSTIESFTINVANLSAETYNAINDLEAKVDGAVEDINEKIDELTEASATKEALSAETARATSVEGQLADSLLATNDLLGELSATVQTQNSENTNEIQNVASKANDNASKLSTLSSSTVALSETLNDTITELYGIQEQLENGIADASGATLEEAKAYTDEQIEAVNAVKVNDLYFDNLSKYIKLVKADGSLTDGIPAEDFLKDSVLTRVEYDEGNERLVFVWNDDDTTRTYIPLAKLSNVYGVGQDSLAFLKMSGTNLSAIVDKADGFEKTLASTKYVDDVASAMTAVIGELVEANNENREDIDRLNGDKSVAGSVEHTVDDKFNTALLTAGLPVTTVTVDDARNHSLIRTIIVNGETKYFVSNNAKDMLAEDKDGYTLSLNRYVNNLENKIATLENENSLLKNRVAILEHRVDDIAATGIDETMVRNIVKSMFVGTDREIKVSETGELGQKLQIGFADDAIFGDYLAN